MNVLELNDLFEEERMRYASCAVRTATPIGKIWRRVREGLQVSTECDVREIGTKDILAKKEGIIVTDKYPLEERERMMNEAFPLQKEKLWG